MLSEDPHKCTVPLPAEPQQSARLTRANMIKLLLAGSNEARSLSFTQIRKVGIENFWGRVDIEFRAPIFKAYERVNSQ